MHALIIEDNILIADMIADELRYQGFESVGCAGTCEQAIALAAEHCPDLIIADHWLAEESGIDAVRKICEDRPIPVVFIVALPDGVLREMPNAVVLQKPFTSVEFAAAIVQLMAGVSPAKADGNAARSLPAG